MHFQILINVRHLYTRWATFTLVLEPIVDEFNDALPDVPDSLVPIGTIQPVHSTGPNFHAFLIRSR